MISPILSFYSNFYKLKKGGVLCDNKDVSARMNMLNEWDKLYKPIETNCSKCLISGITYPNISCNPITIKSTPNNFLATKLSETITYNRDDNYFLLTVEISVSYNNPLSINYINLDSGLCTEELFFLESPFFTETSVTATRTNLNLIKTGDRLYTASFRLSPTTNNGHNGSNLFKINYQIALKDSFNLSVITGNPSYLTLIYQ